MGKILLHSKRIYSANGILRSFFSLHKCFFKTYKNAFNGMLLIGTEFFKIIVPL